MTGVVPEEVLGLRNEEGPEVTHTELGFWIHIYTNHANLEVLLIVVQRLPLRIRQGTSEGVDSKVVLIRDVADNHEPSIVAQCC